MFNALNISKAHFQLSFAYSTASNSFCDIYHHAVILTALIFPLNPLNSNDAAYTYNSGELAKLVELLVAFIKYLLAFRSN